MIFLVHILLRRGLVKCPNTFHRITWGYSLHGNQCFAWKRVKTTVSPTNPELSLQHYLIDWMRLPLYFIYIYIYTHVLKICLQKYTYVIECVLFDCIYFIVLPALIPSMNELVLVDSCSCCSCCFYFTLWGPRRHKSFGS